MGETEGLLLTVAEVRTETPLIRSIRLARPHGKPSPSWQPGAEVRVCLPSLAGDQAFGVVLKSSGESFLIPPDNSILDVLIEAGRDPLHDCKRGGCGICRVQVIEGGPGNRDYILSDAEKAEGKKMQICVSRSKTPRRVTDL
jgi:vanillate O-demethylase ferredoxin subunit